MKKYLYLFAILFLIGCEERSVANVTIGSKLSLPIRCLRLNALSDENRLTKRLKELYSFDEKCDLTLTLSSKKDIVCNSPQNVMLKTSGKFPKSYLKMVVRRGMQIEYSYYIDLYSNVDEDDVEEGFERLKQDLIVDKKRKH